MKCVIFVLTFLLAVLAPAHADTVFQVVNADALPSQDVENPFIDIELPGLLDDQDLRRLTQYADFLLRDLDVEFVTVVISHLGGKSIEEVAVDMVHDRNIGKRTKGARGILLLIAPEERQVRFEVGYDLEYVFPDAFVGYIENEQMRPFFEEGKLGRGIEATVEMIITRTYERIDAGAYDPSQEEKKSEGSEFSGGAGAKSEVAIGIREEPVRRHAGDDSADYFKPGRTPQETFEKYLEACRRGITDPLLDIFTQKDKEFFAEWTTTPAQLRNYLRDYEGEPFKVEIEGGRAALVFSPLERYLIPVFLKRERGGWVLDFYTQYHTVRYSQKRYWFLASYDHEYMFALNKYFTFDKYDYPNLKKGIADWGKQEKR